jgi:hypothetical protein
MAHINMSKVVAGGLLAGLVFNIGDFLINSYVLAGDYQTTLGKLGLDPHVMETPSTIACWVIIDFLFGLIVVWNYAAIRPRFGPGARTAILAALPVYAGATLLAFGFSSMGFMTTAVATKAAVFSAINMAIGSLAGGWLYSEG